ARRTQARNEARMITEPEGLQTILDRTFAEMRQVRESFTPQLTPREVGTITSIATGIAKVSGLPAVGFEELVKFPGDVLGMAFNVDEAEIGVVLLGEYWHLNAGDEVERTGRVMDVVVGDGLLGRVIDPLGRPLDGNGPGAARPARQRFPSTPSSTSATRMCCASIVPSVSARPPSRRPWQPCRKRARW